MLLKIVYFPQKMNMVLDAPRVRSRLLLTKTGHAIISRVSKSDDGSWVCHGFDTSGASYAADAIKLIVLGKNSISSVFFV